MSSATPWSQIRQWGNILRQNGTRTTVPAILCAYCEARGESEEAGAGREGGIGGEGWRKTLGGVLGLMIPPPLKCARIRGEHGTLLSSEVYGGMVRRLKEEMSGEEGLGTEEEELVFGLAEIGGDWIMVGCIPLLWSNVGPSRDISLLFPLGWRVCGEKLELGGVGEAFGGDGKELVELKGKWKCLEALEVLREGRVVDGMDARGKWIQLPFPLPPSSTPSTLPPPYTLTLTLISPSTSTPTSLSLTLPTSPPQPPSQLFLSHIFPWRHSPPFSRHIRDASTVHLWLVFVSLVLAMAMPLAMLGAFDAKGEPVQRGIAFGAYLVYCVPVAFAFSFLSYTHYSPPFPRLTLPIQFLAAVFTPVLAVAYYPTVTRITLILTAVVGGALASLIYALVVHSHFQDSPQSAALEIQKIVQAAAMESADRISRAHLRWKSLQSKILTTSSLSPSSSSSPLPIHSPVVVVPSSEPPHHSPKPPPLSALPWTWRMFSGVIDPRSSPSLYRFALFACGCLLSYLPWVFRVLLLDFYFVGGNDAWAKLGFFFAFRTGSVGLMRLSMTVFEASALGSPKKLAAEKTIFNLFDNTAMKVFSIFMLTSVTSVADFLAFQIVDAASLLTSFFLPFVGERLLCCNRIHFPKLASWFSFFSLRPSASSRRSWARFRGMLFWTFQSGMIADTIAIVSYLVTIPIFRYYLPVDAVPRFADPSRGGNGVSEKDLYSLLTYVAASFLIDRLLHAIILSKSIAQAFAFQHLPNLPVLPPPASGERAFIFATSVFLAHAIHDLQIAIFFADNSQTSLIKPIT